MLTLNYFWKKFKEKNYDWEFIENFLRNSIIVRIQINSYFDAFDIFETLNSAGYDLTASDLIKNFLIKNIDKNCKNRELALNERSDLFNEINLKWNDCVNNNLLNKILIKDVISIWFQIYNSKLNIKTKINEKLIYKLFTEWFNKAERNNDEIWNIIDQFAKISKLLNNLKNFEIVTLENEIKKTRRNNLIFLIKEQLYFLNSFSFTQIIFLILCIIDVLRNLINDDDENTNNILSNSYYLIKKIWYM